MNKVVIFGGGGFVGTALRTLLDQSSTKYASPKSTDVDLTSGISPSIVRDLVDDGDAIIMISALTQEHGKSHNLTDMNIRMAANVISGIEGKNIVHCIYVSSDSVYGKASRMIRESTPLSPDSLYGFMHTTREQIFRENTLHERLTILRPCAIYGLGDTHNAYGINQFIRDAEKSGVITLFGNGEEYRSSIHVDDVALILYRAISDKIFGTFNVNSGKSWRFSQIADIIKDNMSKEITIKTQPRTVPVTHRFFNNSVLTDAFFIPRQTDIGIKQMLGHFSC